MDERKPINIPQVPADASFPDIDLTEQLISNRDALEANQKALVKNLEEQIDQLKGIVDIQNKIQAALEAKIKTLELEIQILGGGCCGHGSGRMD